MNEIVYLVDKCAVAQKYIKFVYSILKALNIGIGCGLR